MKTLSHRLIILIVITLIAYSASAQFKFTSSEVIGQVLTVDTLSGVGTLNVHFNTSKDSSYWYYNDSTQTAFTLSIAKCQTRKGLQVNIFDEGGNDISKSNKDFECNNFGGYRNPVRIYSIASLMELLEKSYEQNAGTEDSLRNRPYYPAACLFDLNETGTDQAFGAYPGKFKRVEYGFRFSFDGVSVLDDDIVFEVDTYDEGNTGLTAAYTFMLSVGHKDSIVAEIPDFYVSGSGKKTVKVAEAAGVSVSDFANKNVYIYLKTAGTGTDISESSMDPIIIFDNFSVSYQMPFWLEPEAGIKHNGEFSNEEVVIAEIDKDTLVGINLKTSGRLGTFIITNDREEEWLKLIALLPEGGLKANDGSGNYTIDVPYTFTPGDIETKAKMVVASPKAGIIDDDMMLYVKVKPKSTEVQSGRLELDCGVRIWYSLFMQGIPATWIKWLKPERGDVLVYPNPANDKVFISVTEPTIISLFNISGNLLKSKMINSENDFIDLSNLSKGVYFLKSEDKGFIQKIMVE